MQDLHDGTGKFIGYLEEYDCGNETRAFDQRGAFVGYFDHRYGYAYDVGGVLKGDNIAVLGQLIAESNSQYDY